MDKCTQCGGENIIMIEYGYGSKIPLEHQYDGISEYKCMDCGYREGRWSKKPLKGNEYEKIYGE